MLKFNNLVNKIIAECSDSNIISEAVTANDIRDMIKQMDKSEAEKVRRYFFEDVKHVFYVAELIARENKSTDSDIDKIIANDIKKNIVNEDEFIRNFISSLSDKEFTSKTVLSKFFDAIFDEVKDTNITKNDIVKFFKKYMGLFSIYYLTKPYITTKPKDYQQILRDIDASRITDDDIKVYTPEIFDTYNKKAKGAFSYAIFLKENLPIAIAHFFSDGKIDYMRAIDPFAFPKHVNVKQAIERSDKIITISSEYFNNINQRPPYHKKSDDEIRRENQIRRSDILDQREKERYKESVKNDIETLLNSIKEDLSHYKEKLMNIDMFDDDITKAFIDLKHDYNLVKEELNDYLASDYKYNDDLTDLVKNLKLKYLRLTELLEEEN